MSRSKLPVVLALDVSTSTGMCWTSGKRADTRVIARKGDESIDEYALRLYYSVVGRCTVVKPAVAVVEDYAFGAIGRSRTILAELGGIVKLALRMSGVPIVLVTSTQWKAYVLGNGHIPKENVKLHILKKFNVDFEGKSQDEADAWAIWKRAQMCFTPQEVSSATAANKGFQGLVEKFHG